MLKKKYSEINKIRRFSLFFLVGIFLFTIVFITINVFVNAETLHVDRWSAMEITIESLLKGVYPYNQLDHLGQTSSNLPALSYLGIPFYLLGDVGFLQPFVFLLFSIWILKSKRNNQTKLAIIVFLLLSPSYWWEIWVKSDLMSNVLLVVLFVDFWKERYKDNTFKNRIALAVIVAFLCLTRGVVVIPLVLMLFYDFSKLCNRNKIIFTSMLLFFIGVLVLPFIIAVPNISVVCEHNPFTHQTKYAPKVLIIISLFLPFLLSKKSKETHKVFVKSLFILSFLLLTTFVLNIFEEGIYKNVYGKAFDLSYLGIMLPFAIMVLSEQVIKMRELHKL